MKILGAATPDAAFYYRVRSPFTILNHTTDHDWDVRQASPALIPEYDVLWLQQNTDPTSYIVARQFKDAGKKVVYDVDDWLFELPPSWDGLPEGRLAIYRQMLDLADVVTCTTQFLHDSLAEVLGMEKKIIILPNCVMMGDWDTLPERESENEKPVVGWFGTINHWDDWQEIASDVTVALAEYDAMLAFIGPKELLYCFPDALLERIMHHGFVRMDSFGAVRRAIKSFDVGIAWSTKTTKAARCRSPLKAYQYGAAGVPFVASSSVYFGCGPAGSDYAVDAHDLRTLLERNLAFLSKARAAAKVWQETVWREHSYEQCASQWLKALEALG